MWVSLLQMRLRSGTIYWLGLAKCSEPVANRANGREIRGWCGACHDAAKRSDSLSEYVAGSDSVQRTSLYSLLPISIFMLRMIRNVCYSTPVAWRLDWGVIARGLSLCSICKIVLGRKARKPSGQRVVDRLISQKGRWIRNYSGIGSKRS